MTQIRLRNAWAWKCAGCGTDNTAEMKQLNEAASREALGIASWESLPPLEYLCTAPIRVRCRECRRIYDAAPDGEALV